MGIPAPHTNVDDELGLVISVLTDEDVVSMQQLFKEKLGSGTRWNMYPIYLIKTQTLLPQEGRNE